MRVSSQADIDTFVSRYVLNNPDRHVATLLVKEKEWAEDERSFMTMAFTKLIRYGEHFRLIARNIRQDDELRNICVDIIASNDQRLARTDNHISAYLQTNRPESHQDEESDSVVPTDIYRFSFYTQDVNDAMTAAPLSEQLQRMAAGIRKYVPYVHVEAVTDARLGLTSQHTDVWVQHLMPVNYAPLPDFRYLNVEESGDVLNVHWGGTSNSSKRAWLNQLKTALSKITGGKEVYDRYEESVYYQDGHVYVTEDATLDDRFVAYCEYSDNEAMIDDSVRYFSSDDTVKMRPISPDTWWYSPEYLAFSLAGFETLGWRWSSVIQFMKTSSLATVYTVYDDITELLSSVRHPLTKADDGNFYPNGTFDFTGGYVTDNALLLLGNSQWHTHTQRIAQEQQHVMTVMSPEEPDRPMMTFGNRLDAWKPFVHNSQLAIYNPESAQISVMGITEVRDLDMYIGDDRENEVSSLDTITIKAGETLMVDSREDDRLKRDVVYTVESGSLSNYELYRFIISGNTIYYTTSPSDTETKSAQMHGYMTATSDVVLKLEGNGSQSFDFVQRIPGQKTDNFLVDPDDPAHSKLSISVVPQTNCLWQSNGMYFDGCSTLDTSMLTERYTQRGYFTEHAFTLQHDGRSAAWSIDSYASVNGTNYNFRQLITSRGISAAVRKMLISNYPIQTAIGYYNPFVQSLEFIYYGLKFNIKFNSDYYNQNIRIGDYNNFDVYFIDEYAPDEENEIYISTVEEIILIVNHQFSRTGGGTSRKSGNVLRVGDTSLSVHGEYDVATAPYGIYTNTICGYTGEGGSLVARRDRSDDSIRSVDTSTWFVQEDFPQDLYADAAENLPSHYVYFPGDETDERGTVVNVKGSHAGILRVKETETSYDASTVSYDTPIGELGTYTDLTRQQRRQRRSFVVSTIDGSTCDNTCNNDAESLDAYIESLTGNFHCYIISENSTDEVVITEDYKPVIITMTRPQRIKFNFGYFGPKTYDVITMAQNDYTVAERCGISLLLSGTQIERVEKLNTYTGNRVIPETVNSPIERNYFVVSDWSVMRINWDAKYYRTYAEDGTYKLIDGYVPGIEDKAFIGSRCMILKSDHITLDDFSSVRIGARKEYVSSAYNTQAKNVRQVKMTINITQAIYYLFESSQAFIDNWVDIQGDIETSVRNYIKNSVSKIYNRQRRREVSLLMVRDPELTEMDVVFGLPSQRERWEETDDYDAQMTVSQNDEMMLVITMTERPGYKVHPVVKIFRTI